MSLRIRQCIFILAVAAFGSLTGPKLLLAAEVLSSVRLDQATIVRGYTISDPAGLIKVGVLPGAVEQPVTVTLKSMSSSEITPPAERELISQVFEYDVLAELPPAKVVKLLPISLAWESDSYRGKAIYFFNKQSQSWVELPSRVDWQSHRLHALSPLPFSQLAVFEKKEPRHADEDHSFGAEEAQLGQTVAFDDSTAWVETFDGTFTAGIRMGLRDALAPPSPEGWQRVSPAYTVDLFGSAPQKAYKLKLKYETPNGTAKSVRFWDKNKQTWVELPTEIDYAASIAVAKSTLSFGTVAVFENEELAFQEGVASWYTTRAYEYGVANNEWPMKSILRVTNTDNGKSVEVSIESRGPFVKGRVVDLTKSAFAQIANPRAGVIRVRVEKINP